MKKKEYTIDGQAFSDLQGFYDQISERVIPSASWGRNLDAFNDILRGGFGTPEEGFILIWKNSNVSRERLGYAETEKELLRRLERCHPSNRKDVVADLEKARCKEGDTIFDWLVEIIEEHCSGGDEEVDGVELWLQ